MKETRIKPGDKVRFSDYGREKYESENDFLFKSEEDMEIYTVENIFLLFDNINNPGKLTLLKRGQKYFHIDFVEHRQNRFDLDWFEKVTPVSSEYYDVGSFGYIDNLIFNFQEDNGYDPDTLVIGGFYLYDLKKISNDDDIKKYLIKPLKLRMSEYSVCYVTRAKERPAECSSEETKPETINQRRKRHGFNPMPNGLDPLPISKTIEKEIEILIDVHYTLYDEYPNVLYVGENYKDALLQSDLIKTPLVGPKVLDGAMIIVKNIRLIVKEQTGENMFVSNLLKNSTVEPKIDEINRKLHSAMTLIGQAMELLNDL